jgi:hypothetical protein
MMVALDLPGFYRACNPSRTLNTQDQTDRQYYIDFSSLRGGDIVEELLLEITLFAPDDPTCQLFAGHIGCGKSTELLRLKAELENAGFHAVYFESSHDLDMADVDIGDILLAIARQISESVDTLDLDVPPVQLQALLQGAIALVDGDATDPDVSLTRELSKITAKAKHSPQLRDRLRQYLEPRTNKILDAINAELIEPATRSLRRQGKRGLVAIVDNLDRIESVQKPWGRPQPEYLFVDRGEQLRQLCCHVVYTIPLALMFSNDLSRLTVRFGSDPKILPMVPVRHRNGTPCTEGIDRLRQMVLARVFPAETPQKRLQLADGVFESLDSLDRLCRASGGHVRNLLRLLHRWIEKDRKLPLTAAGLDATLRERRDRLQLPITDAEWELLHQVARDKQVRGNNGYQTLIRSMFVFEYRDREGSWFDLNPLLAD